MKYLIAYNNINRYITIYNLYCYLNKETVVLNWTRNFRGFFKLKFKIYSYPLLTAYPYPSPKKLRSLTAASIPRKSDFNSLVLVVHKVVKNNRSCR